MELTVGVKCGTSVREATLPQSFVKSSIFVPVRGSKSY